MGTHNYFNIMPGRSVRRQLSRNVISRLISAFILSRLDYCNAVQVFRPQHWHRSKECCTLRRVLSLISGHATTWHQLLWESCIESCIGCRSPRELTIQVVFAGPRVIHWSGAGKHCWHAHGCRGRSVTGYTASNGDYIVPRTNSRPGDRAFSVAAPRARNLLPADDLKIASCSTEMFKRRLKTSV